MYFLFIHYMLHRKSINFTSILDFFDAFLLNSKSNNVSKTKYKEVWYNGGKYRLYVRKILLLKQISPSLHSYASRVSQICDNQSKIYLFFHEWHTQFFVICWAKNWICQSLSIFMPSSLWLIIHLQLIIHLRSCVSVWHYKAILKDIVELGSW